MKKGIIRSTVAAGLLALAIPAGAQGYDLVLTEASGQTVKFALASQPVQTYQGDSTTITVGESALTYALAGIQKQDFQQHTATGIKAITTPDASSARPQLSLSGADVSGLRSGDRVQVYTIEGRLVRQSLADGEGRAAVSLDQLPQGVYILKTPQRSFKISNK